MGLSVRWLLAQPELALTVRGGSAGLDREITFALTTELTEPLRWLSGGELVLTTGMGLALNRADRFRYMHELVDVGVAAIAFGTGLSHAEVPADLIDAAEEFGLPLLEVPLPTPFAAVTKKVMQRIAEQEYEAVLRTSRAQPRMTRAALQGARATVKELASALSATVIMLGVDGSVREMHPKALTAGIEAQIREMIAAGQGTATSRVALTAKGESVAVQSISVGRVMHGHLAVVTDKPLSNVDQVLLGHASSLLALDSEKPARLRHAQNRLNSVALAILMEEEAGAESLWDHLAAAADHSGQVRALTVQCESSSLADRVLATVDEQLNRLGRSLFARTSDREITVLLSGSDSADFAAGLLPARTTSRRMRCGLSLPQPLRRFTTAIQQSVMAASASEPGAAPLEFSGIAGQALLTSPEAVHVLSALSNTLLQPLADYDEHNGTKLVESLRAFLEANGHWESAASLLGVHRHTLRSRIAKAEAVLGCSLDAARVRAELLLALIARG